MKNRILFSLCMFLTACLIVSSVSLADEKSFNLELFKSQISRTNPKYNQYSVIIDDMEARGFINLRGEQKFPDSDGYVYNFTKTGDWCYVVNPDILLRNYGTSKFVPIPRIWFTYYGVHLYTYDTAIFKIGENLYTFEDILVSFDKSNWSRSVNFETSMVCICNSKTHIDFINDWIANGTSPIKVRLKGQKDTRDFIYPEEAQADTLLMFKNFKDAGGLDYLSDL